MRLIDADKLEIKETVRIQLCGLKEYVALYSFTKEQIEEAPTVKAIPTEWIKEWYKKALSKSGFMGDEMVSVKDLLEDWEKENEL